MGTETKDVIKETKNEYSESLYKMLELHFWDLKSEREHYQMAQKRNKQIDRNNSNIRKYYDKLVSGII